LLLPWLPHLRLFHPLESDGNMPPSTARRSLFVTLLLSSSLFTATAQTTATPADPGAAIVTTPAPIARTAMQARDAAWKLLTDAVSDTKHADARIQALGALGQMGSNPRSLHLIANAMLDSDVDVRTAAVLAAGQTKTPAMTTPLRRMLDDKEPEVAFAAASTLWKMNDRSGEDILMAVADGERSASASMMNGTAHSISRDLHHPAALVRFGAMQGAGMLLGPFGYGITAYEYLHKNGSDIARITAIDHLAQNHTAPIRTELLSALTDKDPGVRAASAKGLATWRDAEVAAAIAMLFDDGKPPVRFAAAAAYLNNVGGAGPNKKR